MIDIRKLKELVKLMVENDLSEIDLGDDNEKVVVKRAVAGASIALQPQTMIQGAAPATIVAPADAPPAEDEDLHAITSPMVGTFYSAPDPETPAFVKKGTDLDPQDVVCIVEAMKVFSEIKAECKGTVVKVLVNTGDAVEYGQPLFLVRTK